VIASDGVVRYAQRQSDRHLFTTPYKHKHSAIIESLKEAVKKTPGENQW
jgi:hypothetical protein